MIRKTFACALLLLIHGCSTIASQDELVQFDFPVPAAEAEPEVVPSPPAACAFPGQGLPESTSVFAAGAYSGRELDFQIDDSGHSATQFDIAVNSPNRPVALMLGAYEPTIWNIGWTRDTAILAVMVSGYHRQAVAGLPESVPVINSSYDNQGPCGYFYVNPSRDNNLNPLSRRLFDKPVDMLFPGDRTGRITIGEVLTAGSELITSSRVTPADFYNMDAPLAGLAGLEEAERLGILRKATDADAEAWVMAVEEREPVPDVPPVSGQGIPRPTKPLLLNAYVVLDDFVIPAGLYGANSAVFFVLEGVAVPTGNPGHSTIYDFNTMRCGGTMCSR